jgi:hypothetical protein
MWLQQQQLWLWLWPDSFGITLLDFCYLTFFASYRPVNLLLCPLQHVDKNCQCRCLTQH